MKNAKRNVTLAILTGALIATSGLALADSRGGREGGPRGGMMEMFKAIDTNADGGYAIDEVTSFIAARFTAADANSDGKLSGEEMQAAVEALRAEHGGRESGRGGKMGGDRGDRGQRMFQRVDIDDDGALTLAEVTERATKVFAVMDVDNSGVIEADEMPQRGGKRG